MPSGIDPFDHSSSPSISPVTSEESKSVKRKPTTAGKKLGAAHKYSKDLLSEAKKKKKAGAAKSPRGNAKTLLNTMFKDTFASVEEIMEMNAAVLELCQFSGCSLFTVLYAINEVLPAEKKHYETSSLI